jgi:hypothetical protein
MQLVVDTWPPLLIDIWGDRPDDVGAIIAALEHDDRIRQIQLFLQPPSSDCRSVTAFHLEQILAAMRKPFPALIFLDVTFYVREATPIPVIPDSFLAPRLQSLHLTGIPFPLASLRKFLLSAADLVEVRIRLIPISGYISAEEMVTCLSALTRLEELELWFQRRARRRSRLLPPSTRCVLPALTSLHFKGVYEYMEDLMARIDAPQLDDLLLVLFDQPVLDAPQLAQFISCTPRFKALTELHVLFHHHWGIFVSLPWAIRRGPQFAIQCDPPDHVPVLVELCTSSFLRTLIPVVKHLYLVVNSAAHPRVIERSAAQWLGLLQPFTAVTDLYISWELGLHVGPALHSSVGEGMTEVLPSLQNLFLEDIRNDAFREFVAARQLSGHQIDIYHRYTRWDRKIDPWLEYYGETL